MFCSISGEVPQEPVVSRTSGHLYERRLIEKHLQETAEANGRDGCGTCPMTGEPMSRDTDLVALQGNKAVKPRVVGASSVPGMLAMFQNEWDELMLETFTLKQHLDTTRQELSQALYQHDAACRVIARLMRERDEARGMLSSLAAQGVDTSSATPSFSQQQQGTESGADMEVEEQQKEQDQEQQQEAAAPSGGLLSASVLAVLGDTCATLSKGRKGRKPPASQASKEDLVRGCSAAASSQRLSLTPHASAKPGVTCLAMTDIQPQDQEPGQDSASSSYLALSGGADKMAFVTDLRDGKVVAKLSGHSKKITAVALHASTAFTASADHAIKVWTPNTSSERYSAAFTFSNAHSGEISSLCAHPSGSFLMGVSADNSWSFLDVTRGVSLLQARNGHDGEKFSCGGLHPDGLILACGASSGAVRLWDIREQKNVASLGEAELGHSKDVSCLTFNQNGYLLVSGGGEGSCKVWDLRKLKEVASLDTSPQSRGGGAVTSVSFDPSGVYLAYGSSAGSVDVSVVKEWTCLATLEAHKKAVTGLAWGGEAAFLLSSSMDRTIKQHSFKQ